MDLLTREITMPRMSYMRRIAADIRTDIESGRLAPGAQLPTQDKLAERYGCSLTPVKAAIRVLEAQGYVVTHPGKAMYVADAPPGQPRESDSQLA